MTAEGIALVLAGLTIGIAAGNIYLSMLRRAICTLIEQRKRTSMLWSAPARVALPAVALALAARWDRLALLGGVVGLLATQFTAQLLARTKGVGP
ncbi:hypothetical protein [Enhygromyxa salina]|uniref:N-ATPase, AtpR subunit n=1 Tax=Enhygromyxa salina TaxID=215803 RepID=A0A2S9XPR6_9BACT|nr:hypothetical protein [Enhygromyxa salina]PRP94854.1 N-ATPase, AtpR subunit [Enhygromyxa salina]